METPKSQSRRPLLGPHAVTWLMVAVMVYAIAFAQFMAVDIDEGEKTFEFLISVGFNYPPLGYGWPMPFVKANSRRELVARPADLAGSSKPFPEPACFWSWSRPWPWEWKESTIKYGVLFVNSAVWLAILASTVLLSEMRWRRTQGRWQFSLRGLLGMFGAAALIIPIAQKSILCEWLDLKSQMISCAYLRFPIFVPLRTDEPFWTLPYLEWRVNVAVVALVLCGGLACTFYVGGKLLIRFVRLVAKR